jgi:hypothetical protein
MVDVQSITDQYMHARVGRELGRAITGINDRRLCRRHIIIIIAIVVVVFLYYYYYYYYYYYCESYYMVAIHHTCYDRGIVPWY